MAREGWEFYDQTGIERVLRLQGIALDDSDVTRLLGFHDRIIGDGNHQGIIFQSHDLENQH